MIRPIAWLKDKYYDVYYSYGFGGTCVLIVMLVYAVVTFSAMAYVGSCSGKTSMLNKGLTVQLVKGLLQ